MSDDHAFPLPADTKSVTKPNEYLAPGCYGWALAYSDTAVECVSCPFKEKCKLMAEADMIKFRERLGITEMVASRGARDHGSELKNAVAENSTAREARPIDERLGAPVSEGANTASINAGHPETLQRLSDEAGRRRAALNARLSAGKLDKRFTKLRGRTDELVAAWLARQTLRATKGREPTAVEVARLHNERQPAAVNARAMRRKLEVVEFLEGEGMPWAAAPGEAIAKTGRA